MTDYDIVALRVAMGTATIQQKIESLDDPKKLAVLKRKITEHALKCFDEAVAKAKDEWKKLSGEFSGRQVVSLGSASTEVTDSSERSPARRRMRSVK